ncbi:Uncharacterised protein [Brucella neotomae]|nr:Uncharacterised protein [Brucella neotomae]SUW41404.1 Uncharacterised protein [Brucella neotomae]
MGASQTKVSVTPLRLDDQHFAIHQLGEVAASSLLGDPTSSSKFACSQSTPVHQRYQHRAASGISDKGGYAGNIGAFFHSSTVIEPFVCCNC